MGQQAMTIEEQIKLLKKRNMIIDRVGACKDSTLYTEEDLHSKAKEILLDIGYYRLGFYFYPFEINPKELPRSHNYKKNTHFSDAVKLYYLDSDLRHILYKYLSRIEINFRTKLIYKVSVLYKKSPTWFIDDDVVDVFFINEFDNRVYNYMKDKVEVIKKHHQLHINDKYAPAWKTLEYMTFGSIIKLFDSIKDRELKISIAKDYEIMSLDRFIENLKALKTLRNCCAHGDVLFDFKLNESIKSKGEHMGFKAHENRTNLMATIKIIKHFLKNISSNRVQSLEEDITSVFSHYQEDDTIRKIIEEKIGYTFSA